MSNAPATGTAAGTGTTVAGTTTAPPVPTPSSSLEHLPANVPVLELNGSNWPVFSMRFRKAMTATKRWVYFSGMRARPVPVDPANPTPEEQAQMQAWDDADESVQFLLGQRLQDSTAVTIDKFDTAAQQWMELSAYFTKKSAYVKNDLETTFRELKCPKGGDVRTFLANVHFKRKELKIAGVTIADAEYERTVLKGIPDVTR